MTRGAAVPPPRARAEVRFVHLSDLHFLEDAARPQHGVRTAEIFERAFPLVNAVAADFIVAGGDLTSDEKEASYRQARAAFARLNAPVHILMGNHDDRHVYRSVFHPEKMPSRDPVCGAFVQGSCRFVLLDSHVAGAVHGQMDDYQLAWLDANLAAHAGQATFVFVHHPPLPIGVRWLDDLGFLNGADLVVTGEGRLDEQTAYGKTVQVVARLAKGRSKPVLALVGTLALSPKALAAIGIDAAFAMFEREPTEEQMAGAAEKLSALGEGVARRLEAGAIEGIDLRGGAA